MHSLIRTMTGMAAATAVGAVLFVGVAKHACAQGAQPAAQPGQTAAQPEKKPKDQTEYDLINTVIKDLQGTDAQKTLADLNTWSQKYPETDFKDDRVAYYQQAYATMNPPQNDKVLEYTAQLLNKDLKASFKDPNQILQILYRGAAAVAQGLPNATAEQLATGEKAAQQLLAFIPGFFANKPANVPDAQWNQARTQLETVGQQALVNAVSGPGDQLMAKKDFAGAEQAYRKAYETHQENGLLVYKLGSAIMQEKDPNKYAQGLYYVARGVALDPAKGGIADQATRSQVEAYLNRVYTSVHGSDEGLADLKQTALANPNPPADFKIKTASQIAAEKEEEFKQKNPELAKWMGIKGVLSAQDGEQFFQSQMKETEVTGLKGIVMGGKPECNPKEILVAIPEPDQKSTIVPEVTLKLETPIKGKPVEKSDISFGGEPTAFSKEPFMLTMDVAKDKIPEIKVDPCTPARTAPGKKAAPGGKAAPGKKAPAKKGE